MLKNTDESRTDNQNPKVIYRHTQEYKYCSQAEILNSGVVKKLNHDVSFNLTGVYLFEAFQKTGKLIADKLGCQSKKYPLLLPVETLEKTNYLAKFSHQCIFCNEAAADEIPSPSASLANLRDVPHHLAQYVLSPSACYHMYPDYENSVLEDSLKVSFEQNVCRNEGEIKEEDSFGRLKSYNVREIVFIGEAEFVRQQLHQAEELIKEQFIELGLSFELSRAMDSFVFTQAKILERLQLLHDLKHEFRVHLDKGRSIAVASVNFHDQSFTKAFNISKKNVKQLVSGCVGIGIERMTLAYLAQFGVNSEHWSKGIRDMCDEFIQ
ncbi:aminoacyl--tRNA ligase-related protein [Paenibacillus sp. S150]|uniref:aminoacyl--tRNA ligase-related protein n=1 Tax=Paenibacillus sp. S150 TaxID=2749826 RepID=UPI001C55C1F7|nr:aminoacyl--tRNA ligase-related protein [Paenibacillus sp. S150]MBW4085040.1 hypothetical protein [Paenibacillus sp. S150]